MYGPPGHWTNIKSATMFTKAAACQLFDNHFKTPVIIVQHCVPTNPSMGLQSTGWPLFSVGIPKLGFFLLMFQRVGGKGATCFVTLGMPAHHLKHKPRRSHRISVCIYMYTHLTSLFPKSLVAFTPGRWARVIVARSLPSKVGE